MKKNLLNLLTIVSVCSCFLMYACSSKNNDSSVMNEENANTSESADNLATDTSDTSVDDVLDIENTATSEEVVEQDKLSVLKEILSSYFSLLYDDEDKDAYVEKLENLIKHFKELDKTSLQSSLDKIKNGEKISQQDLKDSIKAFLDSNNISINSLSLTQEDKEAVLEFVSNHKTKILEDLLKLDLHIDRTELINSILSILLSK